MLINWLFFNGVEVQVFEPDAPSRQAIIFCPGFPGMGSTMFEQRHAATFADEGFAVYSIKHKGTRLNQPLSPVMVNNAARLREGRMKRQVFLGGGSATVSEWLSEPLRVLNEIHAQYDDIHVIGNSFGALSALMSLTDNDAKISNVKSILLWAGAQGVDDESVTSIMRIWQPAFLMLPAITEKVSLNDPVDIVETLGCVYKKLPARVKDLPPRIKITYLVIKNDEILWMVDTENFRAAIGGRGEIIVNDEECGFPEHHFMAHDSPMLKTEDLLKIIRG